MLKLTAHILLTNDFEQYAHREIYGVTFVERLIRQCKELKAHTINVWSEKIMFVHSDVYCHPFNEWNQYMSQLRVREEERIIIIDSNIIADDRLIKYLGNHTDSLAITNQYHIVGVNTSRLVKNNIDVFSFETAKKYVANFDPKVIEPNEINKYVHELRLQFVPYFFVYTHALDIRQMQNIMYEANFKGTLDFIATYVYKYPVREITKLLSRHPWVTPDFITVLSIASSFTVPLLLAIGEMGWAVLVGWLMFIFDSVDGKLARLTVRLNPTMGVIEHATSAPAIFLWFAGLGWYFSNGQLLEFTHPASATAWSLMALYWLDKGVNGIFKPRFGIDLYNYAPIDRFFHLFACRRAIIHLIITLGWATGYRDEAFYFLGIWMVISFMFHLFRCGWILATDEPQTVAE